MERLPEDWSTAPDWGWSKERSELFKALAAAQGEIQMAEKDAKNPHLNSRYADLASIWKVCRKPLSAHGIAVTQLPVATAGSDHVRVITILALGEQFVYSTMCLRPAKQDAQGIGSAITYAKRYMLSAMVGVAADDDDDGNAASQSGGTRQQKPQQSPPGRQQPAAQGTAAGSPRGQQPAQQLQGEQAPAGARAGHAAAETPAQAEQPAGDASLRAQGPPESPTIPGQRIPLLHKQSLEEGLFTRDELRQWMADHGAGSLGQVTPAIADQWEAELGRRRATRSEQQQSADDEIDVRF